MKPTFTLGHYDLAIAYMKINKHQQALDEFKRVVELEPRHIDANLKIGIEYLNLGNKDAAIQQYYVLKNIDPEQAQQLYYLIYR
jgi:tetratricopeptide (TPR) repeat protein